MAFIKDPQERFEYYFNVANSLGEKYDKKLKSAEGEKFIYDVTKDPEYKEATEQIAENTRYLTNKKGGDYAAYSLGYDNSLKDITEKDIARSEKEAKKAAASEIERRNYNRWLEQKAGNLMHIKKSYAKKFGDAIYNMQKANEEVMKRKAGY